MNRAFALMCAVVLMVVVARGQEPTSKPADLSSPRAALKTFAEALKSGDLSRLISGQSNDFELPVFREYPGLAWLRDELQMAGAVTAHLCGSGSALYGVARDEQHAKKIADRIRGRYPSTYVVRTLSRVESNPLRELEG